MPVILQGSKIRLEPRLTMIGQSTWSKALDACRGSYWARPSCTFHRCRAPRSPQMINKPSAYCIYIGNVHVYMKYMKHHLCLYLFLLTVIRCFQRFKTRSNSFKGSTSGCHHAARLAMRSWIRRKATKRGSTPLKAGP